MNRDDIIKARAAADEWAENHLQCEGEYHPDFHTVSDVRFAAIVAAAERNRMIADGWRQCAQGQRTTQFCAVAEQARQEEREACAKLVEPDDEHRRDASWGYIGGEEGVEMLDQIAAAIRARSKT